MIYERRKIISNNIKNTPHNKYEVEIRQTNQPLYTILVTAVDKEFATVKAMMQENVLFSNIANVRLFARGDAS